VKRKKRKRKKTELLDTLDKNSGDAKVRFPKGR
jgi:hypothetical protein